MEFAHDNGVLQRNCIFFTDGGVYKKSDIFDGFHSMKLFISFQRIKLGKAQGLYKTKILIKINRIRQ